MTKLLKTIRIISYLVHINKKLWLYDVCTDKYEKNDLHNALLQFIEFPMVTYFTGLLTTDILVKHGFQSTIDVYLMHGSNGVFLPRGAAERFFFKFWPLHQSTVYLKRRAEEHDSVSFN